jgi:hypothetical protein
VLFREGDLDRKLFEARDPTEEARFSSSTESKF